VSYDEWDSQFQELFDDLPGADYLTDGESSHAEILFETGFTHTAEEYESMGLSPDDVAAIREEFFEYMGIDTGDFDWEGWREAMGYDLLYRRDQVARVSRWGGMVPTLTLVYTNRASCVERGFMEF
jgi:hypothetical protein